MNRYGDFLILTVSLAGIALGVGEWIGRTSHKPIERRVEVCSPRSIDNYPPIELRRIAAARERMEKVNGERERMLK